MRGQKLYNEIIKDGGVTSTHRKGRSNSLLHKRNECLIARYYFYGYLKNKSYEETIRLLVAEFFLSPNTIVNLVQTNVGLLQALKDKGPTQYYFVHRWPHFRWMT